MDGIMVKPMEGLSKLTTDINAVLFMNSRLSESVK
jgi:hypothetical protein